MPSSATSPQPEPPDDLIRRRAYFLWLERGSPIGDDWSHWFAAQQQTPVPERAAEPAPHSTSTHLAASIRSTVADHLSDPAHRFHAPESAADDRTHVVAGTAAQRMRGRREGGSLRSQPKKKS